jgi:hypothetical protein
MCSKLSANDDATVRRNAAPVAAEGSKSGGSASIMERKPAVRATADGGQKASRLRRGYP